MMKSRKSMSSWWKQTMLQTVDGARRLHRVIRHTITVDGLDDGQALDGTGAMMMARQWRRRWRIRQAHTGPSVSSDADGRGQNQQEERYSGGSADTDRGFKSSTGAVAVPGRRWKSIDERSGGQRSGFIRLDNSRRLVSVDSQRSRSHLNGVRCCGHQIDLDVVDGVGPERQSHRCGVSVEMTLESTTVHFPSDQIIAGLTVRGSLHWPGHFGDDQNLLVDEWHFPQFPWRCRRHGDNFNLLSQFLFGRQLKRLLGIGVGSVDDNVRGWKERSSDGVFRARVFVFWAVESHQTASANGQDAEVAGRRAWSLTRWKETTFFRSLLEKRNKNDINIFAPEYVLFKKCKKRTKMEEIDMPVATLVRDMISDFDVVDA